MPTEIIPTAAGGFDMLPWILVVLLACMSAYLAYRLITTATPKSSFEDWEACKKLNGQEGAKSAGRWVFLIILGINGHIISTERAERFEGALYRRSGERIWEMKPDSIWNLAGVPTAFVWSDRYTAINIEAGEAITKKSLKDALKRKDAKEEQEKDPKLTTDGWYAAQQLFQDEEPEPVGAPWHVVDISSMREWTAATTPSQFYNLVHRIVATPKKSGSGILSWILDHPLYVVLGAVGVAVVVMFVM